MEVSDVGLRKTHKEFVAEVKALVGDEYLVNSIYKGAKTKIEMIHQTCGEIYQVVPSNFLTGRRCVKCARCKKKKTHKEFVAEVKALVGDEYLVSSIYKNAKTKIEMIHQTCGEIYQVTPDQFLRGSRCAKCARCKKKKTHEEFVAEVKALVGDEYLVIGTYKNTMSKIEMIHQTCGEIYQVTPDQFLRGSRCAKCARCKKKTTQDFKQEVFDLVGDEYLVIGAYKNTMSKIEMIHQTCGEIYQVVPSSFLSGHRCLTCSGCKKKTTQDFKQEVFDLVGDEYLVIGTYKNNRSKIEMIHQTCGEIYQVAPSKFLTGRRCPKCKESKGERAISGWLNDRGIQYTTQEPVRYSREKRPLKLDFYVGGIAIEYDGEQHYRAIGFWGGEKGLRAQQRRDAIKDKYCADNGIPLIRIPYWEYDNIDAILTEKLLPLLKERKYAPAS